MQRSNTSYLRGSNVTDMADGDTSITCSISQGVEFGNEEGIGKSMISEIINLYSSARLGGNKIYPRIRGPGVSLGLTSVLSF